MKTAIAIAALALSLHAQAWRDTDASRAEVRTQLETLNARLLASTSATRTLEEWCGEHHMADEAKIVATRVDGAAKVPSPEQLQRLAVHDASEVRYRRVQLRCGAHVLSVADNWYVPARLTPEMNALLDTTQTPFGKAVQSLHPYRTTIAAKQLWLPSAHRRFRWCRHRTLAIPREVLQHRAVLFTAGHVPFSEVVETYQGELLKDWRN
ncbi:MAG TPA: hypothetical protein VJZ00_12760 [Thermoanaerobaculia bacterium]|nr:hypothetical protein [Thermoanaerobaculia bacterium]